MEPDPQAPERTIRHIHRLAMLGYVAIVATFVFRYRSEGATIGPYSRRYFFGLILPFLALAGAAMYSVLAKGRSDAGTVPRRGLPPLLSWVAGAAVLAAGWAWSLKVSDEYVSIGMTLLIPSMMLALWGRWKGSVEPLIAGLMILAAGLTLFIPELPGLVSGKPLVVWGDTTTFATLFPRQAPFIGEGGRLRPNLNVLMRAPEYRTGARLVTDVNGFRNEEPVLQSPEDGEYRILSLGDSFSTGFCADQDWFFGSLLEKALASRLAPNRRIRVVNAEVSDPAYGLYYLQHYGLTWHPHLVIYGLSGNDAMQAEQFLGADRLFRLVQGRLEPNPDFDPDLPSAWDRFESFAYPAAAPAARPGSPAALLGVKLSRFWILQGLFAGGPAGRQPPADMAGYASAWEHMDSRKRLVDGASNLGFFYRSGGPPVEAMYTAVFDLLDAMARSSQGSGARFMLVVHPQRYQSQEADWDFLVRRWNLDPNDFDLRLANRRLAAFCGERSIDCCDLLDAFEEAAVDGQDGLYLPAGDTHYSRRGHEVAAARAASCIAPH